MVGPARPTMFGPCHGRDRHRLRTFEMVLVPRIHIYGQCRVMDVTGTDLNGFGSSDPIKCSISNKQILCNSCLGFSAFDPFTASYRNICSESF